MELVGLSEFFDLPGAFGDESHDRRDLPALAYERIRKHLQLDLAKEQFIVIGDTPNDIDCAKHFGARALARWHRPALRQTMICSLATPMRYCPICRTSNW